MDSKCGNCRIPFRDKTSRRGTILSSWSKQHHPHFISIYEALSVFFEIPPLIPNETDGVENMLSKKDLFKRGSKFVEGFEPEGNDDGELDDGEADDGRWWLCNECTEILTVLYNNFQEFTTVCRAESEVAKVLKELEVQRIIISESSSSKKSRVDAGNGRRDSISDSSKRNNSLGGEESADFTVKVEPEDDGVASDLDDGGDGFDHLNSPEQMVIAPPVSSIKTLPTSSTGSNDDDDDDDDNYELVTGGESPVNSPPSAPPLPDNIEKQQHTKKVKSDKENAPGDENEENPYLTRLRRRQTQDRHSISSAFKSAVVKSGASTIKPLKCPTCDKVFLHANVLICHRKIIHREKFNLLPPSPIPTLPLFYISTTQNRKKVANESVGKISTCPVCRMEVPRNDIRNHLSNHTRSITKPWMCLICGKGNRNHESLIEHVKVHQACIPCSRCGKKVPRLEMLTHLSQCEKNMVKGKAFLGRTWNCMLCKVTFSNRLKMVEHMETHKQRRAHACKICDKTFGSLAAQRLHVKRFHRNNESGPPSVRSTTSMQADDDDDNDADNHFQDDDPEHDIEDPPAEASEGSPFVSPGAPLLKNDRASTNTSDKEANPFDMTPIIQDLYLCKTCEFKSPDAKDMENHLRQAHATLSTLTCNICNRKLQDEFCLNLHLNSHSDTKPIECFICKKTFGHNQKNHFYFHLKDYHKMDTKTIIIKYPQIFSVANSATGIRIRGQRMQMPPKRGEFPCEVCGKVFHFMHAVRNHRKIVHDKVREFVCSYCGKSFPRKSYFLLHEKLHTSTETPYKCHLCGKGFRLPGNLRMHLQSTIHNPERNFICDVCGKDFNRKDNLRLHVRAVHMKIPPKKSTRSFPSESRQGRRLYGTDVEQGRNNKNLAATIPAQGTSSSFKDTKEDIYNPNLHPSTSSSSMGEFSCPPSNDSKMSQSPPPHPSSSGAVRHSVPHHLANLHMPLIQHPGNDLHGGQNVVALELANQSSDFAAIQQSQMDFIMRGPHHHR